jgi:hypothetical protein
LGGSFPAEAASRTRVALSGQLFDEAFDAHRVRIDWGDGTIGVFDRGISPGGPFSVFRHYKRSGPRHRTIRVIALDDEGTGSAPVVFSIRVHG